VSALGLSAEANVCCNVRLGRPAVRSYSDVFADPGPSMPAGGAMSGFSSRACVRSGSRSFFLTAFCIREGRGARVGSVVSAAHQPCVPCRPGNRGRVASWSPRLRPVQDASPRGNK